MHVFMFEQLSPTSIGEFRHLITKGKSLGSKRILRPRVLFSNVSLMELTALSHPTNLNYGYITRRNVNGPYRLVDERDSLCMTLMPE